MVLLHLSNIVKELGIQLGYHRQDMRGNLDNYKVGFKGVLLILKLEIILVT